MLEALMHAYLLPILQNAGKCGIVTMKAAFCIRSATSVARKIQTHNNRDGELLSPY